MVKVFHKTCCPRKPNQFWVAGRLGPRIWQVKSFKILFFKKYFAGKSWKSEKILPIAPRAGSGQLGRARTGSAQLRTPKNRFLGWKFFIAGMDGFRIADFGCFWIPIRFQLSSTGWGFWVPQLQGHRWPGPLWTMRTCGNSGWDHKGHEANSEFSLKINKIQ